MRYITGWNAWGRRKERASHSKNQVVLKSHSYRVPSTVAVVRSFHVTFNVHIPYSVSKYHGPTLKLSSADSGGEYDTIACCLASFFMTLFYLLQLELANSAA